MEDGAVQRDAASNGARESPIVRRRLVPGSLTDETSGMMPLFA
jgi:hypothetical protein